MEKSKLEFLKQENLENSRADRVTHELFKNINFFDPYDLPQVRYEMLRTVHAEDTSVVNTCKLFGFSREIYYRLERKFMEEGLVCLLGSSKAGRRPLIALNQEIVNYIVYRKIDSPDLSGADLCKEICEIYKVDCSQRTVERLLGTLHLSKKGGR